MNIILLPVAFVKNSRKEAIDDHWGKVISEIVLVDDLKEECLNGLEEFSHAEIIFYFDKADPKRENRGVRHPRDNKNWPLTGVFAHRGKDRPNHIGSTIVKIIKKEGRTLFVSGLDAIDQTPVLDIKPVFSEFLPAAALTQPQWSKELMEKYFL